MEEAPLPTIITPKKNIPETFEIKQNNDNYILTIEIIEEIIKINLINQTNIKEHEVKLTLDELKNINKLFSKFKSLNDFIVFIKPLVMNKKLSVNKLEDQSKISIELNMENLSKDTIIKIDLYQKKINFELISRELFKKLSILSENFKSLEDNYKNLNEENKYFKDENKNLKEEIQSIKKENDDIKNRLMNLEKIIFPNKNVINPIFEKSAEKKNNKEDIKLPVSINSVIMEKDELDTITSVIKARINKEIKQITKIYQSTKDGCESTIFHKMCDNIKNTLVLYKSEGNRRFGGFCSECWKSKGGRVLDKNCFLFSLDKKKVYLPKNNIYYEIPSRLFIGPSFCIGDKYCIQITTNSNKDNILQTNEKDFKEIFDGDENALSEDGSFKGVKAEECEVFQIIF